MDDQYPYLVYGAQQDNTTVIVPSLPLGNGQDFRVGPGCETGPIIPNPANPQVVYGSCKGQFSVQNMATTDEMRYWVGAESLYGNGGGTLIYRFQRVSPMEVSPFAPHAVYYGSQYLHRTRGWRCDVAEDQPRPDGASARRAAGALGHADHARRHRRRGLQHALRDSRIAACRRALSGPDRTTAWCM